MSLDSIYSLEEIKTALVPVFKQYELQKASIFGSYARNEANPHSDIDLLVHLDDTFELEKYLRFETAIKSALKKEVDILEFRCIRPAMQEDILKEAINIYENSGQKNIADDS